jgi:hypothetical protein
VKDTTALGLRTPTVPVTETEYCPATEPVQERTEEADPLAGIVTLSEERPQVSPLEGETEVVRLTIPVNPP